ncbi:DUF4397 domain-containing protein [Hymenobacter lapidiphilus]|uniref:DUF4397 domain-containing protein n=1 Tax=Hymenobacter lapidiphilus TaxID=2608003 RepID=A0A7Y7PT09_9BACT|nr:DUF4397 domain-containing protein [Hymenobacter lapidiphilus]NVO33498.1 DUF4397 domain-containing protein [Hymenobacter lapidiphilus]
MKLFSSIRPVALLATLPAMLAFSACGDDDKDPAPQQGQVMLVHGAASAPIGVQALVNDVAAGSTLDYGRNTNYFAVTAGSPTFTINVAGSNPIVTAVNKKPITVASGKNYSVFAYPNSATTVDLLPIEDDLTAPAAGQTKIRIVHLVFNGPSPVKLSQTSISGTGDVPNAVAAFGQASPFVSVAAGTYDLNITTGPASTTVVKVGDGSGSGTGTKNYEAGKIYTIVVRGIAGSLEPAKLPKASIVANN